MQNLSRRQVIRSHFLLFCSLASPLGYSHVLYQANTPEQAVKAAVIMPTQGVDTKLESKAIIPTPFARSQPS